MIDDKYIEYPTKILNNEIVACEYVKLASQRFLKWFERDDMYFDSSKVDKVVNFMQKLKHFTRFT